VKNHILYQYGRCRFPNMEEIYSKKTKKDTSWIATTCKEHQICNRHKSKQLLKTPFCPSDEFSVFDKVKQADILSKCGPVNTKLASSECNYKSIVGAKILRLCRISDLRHLSFDEEIEWKFIWLVRDPRATAASQGGLKMQICIWTYCWRKSRGTGN
jgi:hypothetical protein